MQTLAGIYHANRLEKHWLEDVHNQRKLGRHYNFDCGRPPTLACLQRLIILSQAVFWVETKGKSLEEVDAIFDEGRQLSNIPDVEEVRRGKKSINVLEVEKQLESDNV